MLLPISRSRRRLLGALGCAAAASAWPEMASAIAATPSSPAVDAGPLLVTPGRLGPQLIAAGAIEPARFAQACASAGAPLDAARLRILAAGNDAAIAFDASSAHFLLNFFWAVGLANANPILTRGPMAQNGLSRIAGYASTGGWSLAARPVMDIYAATPLIALSAEQQQRLEEVTANVFRPCCDNPTSFPDCNHGMAMLGLLTHIAAEDRDVDALYVAAKAANAFWFPQQSGQLARYIDATRRIDYARLDPRQASSRALFSGSGFRNVSSWLVEHGLGGAAGGANC